MKKENTKELRKLVANFCDSNIILSSSPISSLLKYLVDTPDFLNIIKESAQLTNYQIEYGRATSTSDGESFFSLPKSDYKIVSLVTVLLFEFDKGTTSIINFVSTFFPSINPQSSFDLFCKSVILPYEESLIRIYNEVATNEQEFIEPPLQKTILFDKVKEECQDLFNHIIEKLSNDTTLSDSVKLEANKIVSGMLYSLELNNSLIIDYMMIGFNRVFASLPRYNRELSILKSILKSYGVIS